jgi:hypothetical protein
VIQRALSELDPAARARFFDELGLQQADFRPGVGLRDGLPDLLWRRVPPGSFWMGGDPPPSEHGEVAPLGANLTRAGR